MFTILLVDIVMFTDNLSSPYITVLFRYFLLFLIIISIIIAHDSVRLKIQGL